jgi:hypothetical protein
VRTTILLCVILLTGCSSQPRFKVVEGTNAPGVLAVDTKTGQMCRTNKRLDAQPIEQGLPYCVDLTRRAPA